MCFLKKIESLISNRMTIYTWKRKRINQADWWKYFACWSDLELGLSKNNTKGKNKFPNFTSKKLENEYFYSKCIKICRKCGKATNWWWRLYFITIFSTSGSKKKIEKICVELQRKPLERPVACKMHFKIYVNIVRLYICWCPFVDDNLYFLVDESTHYSSPQKRKNIKYNISVDVLNVKKSSTVLWNLLGYGPGVRMEKDKKILWIDRLEKKKKDEEREKNVEMFTQDHHAV